MDAKLAGILKLSTKKIKLFQFFVEPFLLGNLENLELLIFLDKKRSILAPRLLIRTTFNLIFIC